ncbi:MAG: hypothetical protein OEW77_05585 [Gemmatimonadota bacterium]|nr:hypothetical protein [Gemmatimonadota bacterium]
MTSFAVGVLTVLALAVPVGAQANPYVYFGGGGTFPMGDYGDYAKTGWLANIGIGMDLGSSGLWGDIDFFYGSNGHSDVDGDKTNLTIGALAIGYTFNREATVKPYIVGTVGTMTHAYKSDQFPSAEGSESMLVFGGGAGLAWTRSERTTFWAETRYMTGSKDGSSTNFVPLLVGMSFNLKK